MKKREQPKRKDNVIYFPGLEKRLTDKGLESLEKKKFKEAIPLLEEARELDPDNDSILIGLVLAYFEAGSFKNAKVLAKEMLLKGIGDYIQLVDLYLTVLIQMHEYHEIVSTIEALFDEKEIPTEKQDHFLTILQFSRRMAENRQTPTEEENVFEETNAKELNLLTTKNLNEQLLLISSLAEKNIRPYVNEIADYLKSETGHPFLKTVLLTLLKEQEIDRDFVIKKFTSEESFHPFNLPEVRVHPKMNRVKELLEAQLESNNPVLFEQTIGMVERTFFISYPFDFQPEKPAAWAAAFHLLAEDYLGMDGKVERLSSEYQISMEEIEQARAQIEEIEKISYPNI